MDESVVLSKEGSLSNSKTALGQIPTLVRCQAAWGLVAWPGLGPAQGPPDPRTGKPGNENECVCQV